MDQVERDQEIAERRKARWDADFALSFAPDKAPPADVRLAFATEYAAYQLGQINRKLDRLIAAAERLADSQPDPRPFSRIKAEREQNRKG